MRSSFNRASQDVRDAIDLRGYSSKIILGVIAILITWSSLSSAEVGAEPTTEAPSMLLPLREGAINAVPTPPFVAPWLTFNTSFSSLSSGSPVALALGDVDRDGDLDVLYGNTRTWDGNTGHVVQLRNNGTGLLSRGADIPLGFYSAGPADLAAADLNGNGAVDILAAAYVGRVSDGVYLIQNDGTGGFGPATLYSAGQITSAVAAADVNGDGRLDVLTADSYSNAVTVRYNSASGPFPILADEFVAFDQVFQKAADIDGDGRTM